MKSQTIADVRKQDINKTKDELISEIEKLRKQIARMKTRGNNRGRKSSAEPDDSINMKLKAYHERLKGFPASDKAPGGESKQHIRAEVSPAKTVEMCRLLVENAADVITLSDLDFNTLFHNRAYHSSLGYDDENIDLDGFDRIHPDDAQKIKTSRDELFKTGEVEFEYRIRHKEGRWIYRHVKAAIIYDGARRQESILSIMRDVTAYKQTEEQARLHQEQLIQADKMVSLGTLVSGVAHEINNPNNFVMLNIPMLQKAWDSVLPILDEYVKNKGDFFVGDRLKYSNMKQSIPLLLSGILEGTKRIKNIVEQLKNFSRMETFDSTQSVDINQVIKSAVTLIGNLIQQSTNRFSIDYGKNLPSLQGNFQRLEQVIINLIENSCQALPDKNKAISISTQYDKAANIVKVNVQDEGVGMDADTLSKILDPFFTTRRHSKGTGLGLSVSSNIIKNHDGFLNFDSSPGKGTIATIILPVKRDEK